MGSSLVFKEPVVVGAGVIGPQIAQSWAQAGYRVKLVDIADEILKRAVSNIRSNLEGLAEAEVIDFEEVETVLSRIIPTTDLEASVKNSDFILEAIPESLELKRGLFQRLDKISLPEAILARNASTIPITAMAEATERPERVIGYHVIAPPYITLPVEVIPGAKTSAKTLEATKAFVRSIGKIPIVCKDIPGKIINRIQFAMTNEAIKLLEQGAATAEDIDLACRLSFGLRLPIMGPLRSNDLAATLKTTLLGLEYLYKATGEDTFRPTELLKKKVEAGELGPWSGKGWYSYEGVDVKALLKERDRVLIEMVKFLKERGLLPTTKKVGSRPH
ncbi:MAG: 3-hydroxyacyl-CoA dehydrogenase family protein [Nitrososphaerota archaeon]